MKTITEIQLRLRSLEEEFHRSFQELQQDLEHLKPKPVDELKELYRSINTIAEENCIQHPNLKTESEYVKSCYTKLLSLLVPVGGADITHRLIYLMRIVRGCGVSASPEEIHLAMTEVTTENLAHLLETIPVKLHLPLILDALMIACIAGTPAQEDIALIGELGALLAITKQDMATTAQLSKILLEEDKDGFLALDPGAPYPMLGYAVPVAWLDEMCKRYYEPVFFFSKDIKYYKRDGDYVPKGGTIKVYGETIYTAEKSGILRTENLERLNSEFSDLFNPSYYIVSCFDPR